MIFTSGKCSIAMPQTKSSDDLIIKESIYIHLLRPLVAGRKLTVLSSARWVGSLIGKKWHIFVREVLRSTRRSPSSMHATRVVARTIDWTSKRPLQPPTLSRHFLSKLTNQKKRYPPFLEIRQNLPSVLSGNVAGLYLDKTLRLFVDWGRVNLAWWIWRERFTRAW